MRNKYYIGVSKLVTHDFWRQVRAAVEVVKKGLGQVFAPDDGSEYESNMTRSHRKNAASSLFKLKGYEACALQIPARFGPRAPLTVSVEISAAWASAAMLGEASVRVVQVDLKSDGQGARRYQELLDERLSCATGGSPVDWLHDVQSNWPSDRAASLAVVDLDVENDRFRIALAGGHPPPVLRQNGVTAAVPLDRRPVSAGARLTPDLAVVPWFPFEAGSLLVLANGGVVNADISQGTRLGMAQLMRAVEAADGLREVLNSVWRAVLRQLDGHPLENDLNVLVIARSRIQSVALAHEHLPAEGSRLRKLFASVRSQPTPSFQEQLMNKSFDMASKVCTNYFYPENMVAGSKYDAVARRPGGHCAVAAPMLQQLGYPVNLYGRYTDNDAPLLAAHEALGIRSEMQKVDGPGAINVVLGEGSEPVILRVTASSASWTPTTAEANTLQRSKAAAMAIGGSMCPEYAAFFLETAAAKGLPCFYNAARGADFSRVGVGEVYIQVSYAEFGGGETTARELATQLLLATGAAGCVVTDSVRGSFGILRGDNVVLHAPAIVLPAQPFSRTVGCGDAHFSGFAIGMLNAPREIRLERGLHLGRLLAAWHIAAQSKLNWSELRRFEQQYALPQSENIRIAA
jgi:sugar/nucleoside kinase (ribokinase family)